MAIKVNGTTVINDSRQLQNVASVDATTVAALGAAGVGGSSAYTTTTYTSSAVGISRNTDPNYGNYALSKGATRDTAPVASMQGWVQLIPAGTTGFIKVSVDKSKFTLYKYATDQYPYWSARAEIILYDKYTETYRVMMTSPVERTITQNTNHGLNLTGTVEEAFAYNYYPSGASIILMMGGLYHDNTVLRGGISAAAGALTIEYLSNET
jgi:hypothetical protein